MKCLIFVITLFSIGRFIDVQGENGADSNLSGDDPVSFEITEELEQSNDENASKDVISEKKDNHEKIHIQNLGNIMGKGETELFLAEIQEGDNSDLIGQNQHIEQSNFYNDLGRRSLAQALKNVAAENVDYLTPEKAPPELVLLVAKESALLRAGKDLESDFDRKRILRSGHYWNGVWKEEVNPKSAMRSSSQKKKLIEPSRYEVAPELRFIHYPSIASMNYYAKRRNEVRPAKPQRTSRAPMKRRRL